MTKSELIEVLAAEQPQLAHRDVELAVNGLLEHMAQALAGGDRIEVRGFGSLSLHHRPARVGRNPKTGESVPVPEKHVPHFKPGRDLRERVDKAAGHAPVSPGSTGPAGSSSTQSSAVSSPVAGQSAVSAPGKGGNSGNDSSDAAKRTASDNAAPRISAAPGPRSES